MISEDIVRVHVENAQDLKVQKTEEQEPEHVTFTTFVVANGVSGINLIEQVAEEDPLRKEVSILAIDSPVVVCHSYAQASNPANQVASVPFPQGAYLPINTALTLNTTARIWVVATVNTASRVGVSITRRDK